MDSDLPELIYTEDNTIFPYSCEESEFVDQHHEHILNSNFKIIRDNELEEIFINRPKFGEEKIISSKKNPNLTLLPNGMSLMKLGAQNMVMTKTYLMNGNQI